MMKRILLAAALAGSMASSQAAPAPPVSGAFAEKMAGVMATPLFWGALYLAVRHHKCDFDKDRFRRLAEWEISHSEEQVLGLFDRPNTFQFGFMFKSDNKTDLCNAAERIYNLFDASK